MELFSRDKTTADQYKQSCKKCASVYFKNWRTKNRVKILKSDRIKHFKREYGFSEEEAQAWEKNKIGLCEICNVKTSLVVDHNHVIGNVRGRLCLYCNSLLGYSRENPLILEAAKLYLEKHNA